jgi:hypothetical protein
VALVDRLAHLLRLTIEKNKLVKEERKKLKKKKKKKTFILFFLTESL